MARLRQLGPALPRLGPSMARLGDGETAEGARDRVRPWRRWYKSQRWQRLRAFVLARDGYACARCGRTGEGRALHVDHVDPHRGDAARFWSGPFQVLCAGCHGRKQREEGGG